MPSRARLQVERPELINAENDLRVVVPWGDLAVGERVQMLDAGLLRRVSRVFGGLPGFQALGDALLAEQGPAGPRG